MSKDRGEDVTDSVDMGAVSTLDDLAALVEDRQDLYVRWSMGPDDDRSGRSRDELTGVELPGLSASALAVEPWWGQRPLRLWVARRLYDYRHLAQRRPGALPWVLVGDERGRGPDNEPLVECVEPVAWVSEGVVSEASTLVNGVDEEWGTLARDRSAGPAA